MHQQLWGYKVEEKLNLGVREQKRLNTTVLQHHAQANTTAATDALSLVSTGKISKKAHLKRCLEIQ
jgi:hypothetical protein